jgi:hypothetical protein
VGLGVSVTCDVSDRGVIIVLSERVCWLVDAGDSVKVGGAGTSPEAADPRLKKATTVLGTETGEEPALDTLGFIPQHTADLRGGSPLTLPNLSFYSAVISTASNQH